jgi:catechol 2,3-dioxygenase-like lactoylglutathione lyase family enzyme
MLASSKLIAFVSTRDPARSREFYEGTLGLPLVSDEQPLALGFETGGTMLRVTIVQEHTPAPYTVLGWAVDDIQAAVGELQGKGVTFECYSWMQQDDLGIWTSSGGARIAWFKDPDGNLLSLTQF